MTKVWNAVYVSCAIGTLQSEVDKTFAAIAEAGGVPFRWHYGQKYEEGIFDGAAAFVILREENSFSVHIDDLTRGVKKETNRAIALNIPIYLSYTTTEPKTKLYLIDYKRLEDELVAAFAGEKSTNHLKKLLEDRKVYSVNGVYQNPSWQNLPKTNHVSEQDNMLERLKEMYGKSGVPNLEEVQKQASQNQPSLRKYPLTPNEAIKDVWHSITFVDHLNLIKDKNEPIKISPEDLMKISEEQGFLFVGDTEVKYSWISFLAVHYRYLPEKEREYIILL